MYHIVERQKKRDERSELHTESCLRSFAWKTWLIAWSSGSLFNEENTRGGRTNDSYREKNWIFRLANCVTGRGSYRNDVGIFARLWIINKPAAQETVNRCISVNLKRDKREHRARGKKKRGERKRRTEKESTTNGKHTVGHFQIRSLRFFCSFTGVLWQRGVCFIGYSFDRRFSSKYTPSAKSFEPLWKIRAKSCTWDSGSVSFNLWNKSCNESRTAFLYIELEY